RLNTTALPDSLTASSRCFPPDPSPAAARSKAYAVLRPRASGATVVQAGSPPGDSLTRVDLSRSGSGAGNIQVGPSDRDFSRRSTYGPRVFCGRLCAKTETETERTALFEQLCGNFRRHCQALAIERIMATFSLTASNDETAVSHDL